MTTEQKGYGLYDVVVIGILTCPSSVECGGLECSGSWWWLVCGVTAGDLGKHSSLTLNLQTLPCSLRVCVSQVKVRHLTLFLSSWSCVQCPSLLKKDEL